MSRKDFHSILQPRQGNCTPSFIQTARFPNALTLQLFLRSGPWWTSLTIPFVVRWPGFTMRALSIVPHFWTTRTNPMRGKSMPFVSTTRLALPKYIRGRA